MKKWMTLTALASCFTSTLGFAAPVDSANSDYQIVLCGELCTQNDIDRLLNRALPPLQCYLGNGGEEQCYAKPKNLLIYQTTSGSVSSFQVGYNNQGLSRSTLSPYFSQVPYTQNMHDNSMFEEIIHVYEQLENTVLNKPVNQMLTLTDTSSLVGLYSENDIITSLEKEYSAVYVEQQKALAGGINSKLNIDGNQFSFSIENKRFSGSWYRLPYILYSQADVDAPTIDNIAFSLSLVQGAIKVQPDLRFTHITGSSLQQLKMGSGNYNQAFLTADTFTGLSTLFNARASLPLEGGLQGQNGRDTSSCRWQFQDEAGNTHFSMMGMC